jgi:hypothetical protein
VLIHTGQAIAALENSNISGYLCVYFIAAYLCVGCKELLVRELIERVIAKNVPFEMQNN